MADPAFCNIAMGRTYQWEHGSGYAHDHIWKGRASRFAYIILNILLFLMESISTWQKHFWPYDGNDNISMMFYFVVSCISMLYDTAHYWCPYIALQWWNVHVIGNVWHLPNTWLKCWVERRKDGWANPDANWWGHPIWRIGNVIYRISRV